MFIPRIPLIFFTRFVNMERNLSPHPDPIPVGIPLIQRLLLMRRIHMMGWILAILPLTLGLFVLRSSPEPFALGLVSGVAWFVLSRAVPENLEGGFGVIPMSLIQNVNNLRDPDEICCKRQLLQWEVRAIRCRHCREISLNRSRPDLGRIRADGRLKGILRILLIDGASVYPNIGESIISDGVKTVGEVLEEE
tara:strand:- start:11 stop:589 length:579 start_codon:yes stop_codon:yes gene_type:complete